MTHAKTLPSASDRRRFLRYTWRGVEASLSLALLRGAELFAAPWLGTNPFTLGVASGDPTPDGIVLWTRLAPEPRNPGEPRPVRDSRRLAVASRPTAACASVVARGVATGAGRARAFGARRSRRACCRGRDYFYQFDVRGEESPIGHFRTAPRGARAGCASCASRSRPARTGRAATTRRTATCCSTISISCCTSATTPTSTRSTRPTRVACPCPAGFERGVRGPAHLPAAAHAVQARSRSAGGAREVPVRRDLGRSRGRRTTTRGWRPSTARRRRSSPRGAPPPTRPTTSTCRSARTVALNPRPGCASTARLRYGRLAEFTHARRSPVPLRQPVRRRRVAALRGGARRATTRCSAATGAVGGAAASRARPRAGTSSRSSC